jgi:hypothetical protein
MVPDVIRIAVPTVSRDEVTELGWDLDWVFEDLVGGDGQPEEKIWLTEDERSSIHFIEDHVLNVNYIAVEGEKKEKIAAQIRARLRALDMDDLERLFDEAEDADDWIAAIYRVAASTSGTCDAELLSFYRRALEHDDPEVRRAAIYAMAYPAWKEFRPILEETKAKDPDPRVRDYAAEMLTELETRYWSDDPG